jgi:hypothetical protein
MNYKQLYDKIIESSKNKKIIGYTETHHIIPRSIGGTDDKDNLIMLSARDHFLCHYLLAKMYPKFTEEWFKMNNAFIMMKARSSDNRYINSRLYESLRKNFSLVMSRNQSGTNNSNFGTIWIHNTAIKKNKKIKKSDNIPLGWQYGRKIIWEEQYSICKCCGSSYIKTQGKYCSDACRKNKVHQNRIFSDETISVVSKKYDIVYNSISKNKDFITELLSLGVTRRQIFKFLKCNQSGTNYKTFNNIRL